MIDQKIFNYVVYKIPPELSLIQQRYRVDPFTENLCESEEYLYATGFVEGKPVMQKFYVSDETLKKIQNAISDLQSLTIQQKIQMYNTRGVLPIDFHLFSEESECYGDCVFCHDHCFIHDGMGVPINDPNAREEPGCTSTMPALGQSDIITGTLYICRKCSVQLGYNPKQEQSLKYTSCKKCSRSVVCTRPWYNMLEKNDLLNDIICPHCLVSSEYANSMYFVPTGCTNCNERTIGYLGSLKYFNTNEIYCKKCDDLVIPVNDSFTIKIKEESGYYTWSLAEGMNTRLTSDEKFRKYTEAVYNAQITTKKFILEKYGIQKQLWL